MSARATLLTFSILASVVARAQAHAQTDARLDVSSGAIGGITGAWLRETNATGAFNAARANSFASFSAALRENAGRVSIGGTRLESAWQPAPVGAFRFSLSSIVAAAPVTDARFLTAETRAHASMRIGTGGLWIGAASSDAGEITALAGVWQALGSALVSLSLEPRSTRFSRQAIREHQVSGIDSTYTDTAGWHVYPATFTRVDTASETLLRARPALVLRGDWANARWNISASGVRRTRVDSVPTTSATLSVAARVAGNIGFVASVGAATRATARERDPSRFVSIGVRLRSSWVERVPEVPVRPVATAFSVVPVADGGYRLTLTVPGARTAEISGDFNAWTAVALQRTAPNTWEITLPLTPGAHRVNVRINGDAWTAPPGVPTVADEFNGRVGIVIVR